MSAVPELGRAARVEPPATPGAQAAQDLYRRFSGPIYGYCLHQLGSREEAEDAVQTTFMNVFRGLQSGVVPRVEAAWLFKIARNVCLSRRRSSRRRGRVEAPNNFEVLQEIVPARERRTDELMRLQDALGTMPETQRRAILLREWQGLSYREIGEELQLSQAAVETLIFRARRALAANLQASSADASWRRRARHGIDASGLLAAAKGFFGAGTTVKVVAAVAALTTTAVATTELRHQGAPVQRSHPQRSNVTRRVAPQRAVARRDVSHARSVAFVRAGRSNRAVISLAAPSHARSRAVHGQQRSDISAASHDAIAPAAKAHAPAGAAHRATHFGAHTRTKPVTHSNNGHAYGHVKRSDDATGPAPSPKTLDPPRAQSATPHAQSAAPQAPPSPPTPASPPAPAAPDAQPAGTAPESPGNADEPHGIGH